MKAGPSWGWEEGLQALSSGPLATDAAADPCGTLWVGCKVSVRSFQDRVRAGVLAPVWGTIPTASGLHPEAAVVFWGGEQAQGPAHVSVLFPSSCINFIVKYLENKSYTFQKK